VTPQERLEKLKAKDRAIHGAIIALSDDIAACHAQKRTLNDRLQENFRKDRNYERSADFSRTTDEIKEIEKRMAALQAEQGHIRARWQPVNHLARACDAYLKAKKADALKESVTATLAQKEPKGHLITADDSGPSIAVTYLR